MSSVNIILCFFVFLVCLFSTVFLEKRLIPFLQSRAKQPIYEGGPSWHASKSGTPTMGGVAFVCSITIALFVVGICILSTTQHQKIAISLLISLIFAVGNALIGFCDDLTKILRNKNAGLTPWQKLMFQALLSILFLMARAYFLKDSTEIAFPFGKINLGPFYYPLAITLLLGIINCANLTDGIDGLATSVAWLIGGIFAILSLATLSESTILSFALMGGTIGFLFYNVHPAKIFMGDTGSLFLGAMTVSIAFTFDNPFIILLIGGVYVIEGASVILQVLSFKLFKRRILRMAPLHHHLEQIGYKENTICMLAVIVTLILSVPAILFFNM